MYQRLQGNFFLRISPRRMREAAGHEETVTKAGKLVQGRKVTPLPFMRRDGWEPYHVQEAGVLRDLLPLPWLLCVAPPHDAAATSKGKM